MGPPSRQNGSGGGKIKEHKGKDARAEAQLATRVQEMEYLRKRVAEEAPAPGSQPFNEQGAKRKLFKELPISKVTLRGLGQGKFSEMTDIQLAAIPHALAGRDVLGAAKTGSGKTLAFVVPVLEKLYREGWSLTDGLGGLIITPTRELALQIFEVVRTVGKSHNLSAALLTGGKKEFREEQRRIGRMNIVVATPGRLLQHLQETPGFDPSQLQVLVLDEADRILDLGFSQQLNSILTYLPSDGRQTLLFSATQTKSVKDLARLSLHQPEYVGVHDKDETATPSQLVQNYIVTELPDKLDMLWSFIRTHIRHKIIVFFSSCSQVRFVYECFRCMQPGTPLLALHGKIKQMRRTHIYFDFVRRPSAVLFATDIAARGLDFPECDWVVQVDAPEDAAMYIHRVGRTARYQSGGRSLTFLLPSEEAGMLRALKEANVPIKKLTINPDKTTSVKQKAAAVVASNVECKRLANKAFTSYLRSVSLMPDKEVFDVQALPIDDFAESLGLVKAPSLKFLKTTGDREEVRQKKNRNKALERLKEKIKVERAAKKGLPVEPAKKKKAAEQDSSDSSDDEEEGEEEGGADGMDVDGGDFLKVKRKHEWEDAEEDEEEGGLEPQGPKKKKVKPLKIKLDEAARKNKKIRFTDEGDEEQQDGDGGQAEEDEDEEDSPEETNGNGREVDLKDMDAVREENESYVKKVQARLQAAREHDRAQERERIREKHLKRRLRERGERTEEVGVTLGSAVEEEDDEDEMQSGSDEEEEDSARSDASGGDDDSGSEEEEEEEEEEAEEDEEGRDDDDSSEEEERVEARRPQAKKSPGGTGGLSLKQQEEAVLRMLRGKK